MTIDDTVIVSAFGSAFGILTTVITVLWRKLASDHAEVVRRVSALEAENARLRQLLTPGETAIAKIDSCPQRACPWRDPEAKRETTRVVLREAI